MPEDPTDPSIRRSQPERRAATRRRIIDASLDVFSRKGFQAASIDEIATNAGMSKGAVYYNFASKEDLFLSLLDQQFLRIQDLIREPPAPGGASVAARFVNAIEQLPGWLPLYLEFIAYAARNPRVREEFGRRFVRASREQIAMTIDALLDAGGHPRPDDAEQTAIAVSALMNGMVIERFFDPLEVPDAVLDHSLLRLLSVDPDPEPNSNPEPNSDPGPDSDG